MRKLLLVITVLIYAVMLRADASLTQLVTVHQEQVFDFSGTEFFELRRGAEVAVVSIDSKAELAQWLRQHEGQKIVITLEKP